jgi:hypothetical protein
MKLFFALIALAALPILAGDRNLTGTWKISIDVGGDTHEAVCTFKQDGEKLTGNCKGETGDSAITGQIQAEKITWQHTVPYEGDNLTLTYTGAFSTDTAIKGTVHVSPFEIDGDFTGQKAAGPDK